MEEVEVGPGAQVPDEAEPDASHAAFVQALQRRLVERDRQLHPQLRVLLGRLTLKRVDGLADHPQVQVEPDARDVTGLLRPEQGAIYVDGTNTTAATSSSPIAPRNSIPGRPRNMSVCS